MKQVTALIHHSRIEVVVQALIDGGFHHLVLQEVRPVLGSCVECRGPGGDPSWLPVSEVQLSMVVDPSDVDAVTSIIRTVARIDDRAAAHDQQGGYVCVCELEQVLPIGRQEFASRIVTKVLP